MKTLQFLIDNICADFTVESLLGLVRTCLANGPTTISGITQAIIEKDSSLDVRCAEGLSEGAVLTMSERGDVEVRESLVYAIGTSYSPAVISRPIEHGNRPAG